MIGHEQMLELKRWNTPTIYNGWEQITSHNIAADGFNMEETRDFMPQMGPMVGRAITVVILIQTIFLLSIFAEIFVTTNGAFGTRTLTYLVYQRVLESQNIGLGSAGGIVAVILANIVAFFLMRIVGKNLDN